MSMIFFENDEKDVQDISCQGHSAASNLVGNGE